MSRRMLRRVGPWLLFALGVVGLLVLLAAWQRNAYWEYSDGVYAASARELLHGRDLYEQMAGAQPPFVYLVGALLLWFHDGLASIRAGMALLDLATAALVVLAVFRLTGRRWLAAASGLIALFLPWTLHEHAQLTPETLAAPLIMGAALARGRATGVLGALAIGCKLAFALPAVLVGVAVGRRALVWLVVATLVLAAIGTAIFGTDLWRQTVTAQLQVGTHSLHYVGGLWAQAAWNVVPLAIPAVAAIVLRERALEPRLVMSLSAAALGGLILVISVYKNGTYLNVLQIAEAPLLALAAAGAAWLVETRTLAVGAVALCLAVLGVAQVASLLANPGNPRPFARPFAATAPGWTLSPHGVDVASDRARACPPDAAYSGPPYVAFEADRRMPGRQPDQFIVANARENARFLREAAADQPRCP